MPGYGKDIREAQRQPTAGFLHHDNRPQSPIRSDRVQKRVHRLTDASGDFHNNKYCFDNRIYLLNCTIILALVEIHI